MTQCERLLKFLQSGRRINPLVSWNELGIYRLASRISDLKKDGWAIISDRITVQSKYGTDAIVAEYRLESIEAQGELAL